MKFNNMQDLREELDLLDNKLIVLISKRFKLIEQAAIIKNDETKIRDNERIESIISRLRDLAEENSISADIVEKLWRFIIELSIDLEKEIFKWKYIFRSDRFFWFQRRLEESITIILEILIQKESWFKESLIWIIIKSNRNYYVQYFWSSTTR